MSYTTSVYEELSFEKICVVRFEFHTK